MLIRILAAIRILLGDFYKPAEALLKIIAIILLSVIAIKVGNLVIKKVFEKRKALSKDFSEKKFNTMLTLILSAFKYSIYIIAGVIIMTDVFNLTSILAAAGVGGIAIGLGAQSLIRDVISGFFIVMEDQYAVGDVITIDGLNGTVEELGLRMTKLRNFNGDLCVIPNGEIKKVINHTRGKKAIIVDIPVSYGERTGRVVEIAEETCKNVAREYEGVVDKLEILGITELGKGSFNLRIYGTAQPNTQGEIERKIRELIVEKLYKEGITL